MNKVSGLKTIDVELWKWFPPDDEFAIKWRGYAS
jgi:hypothetical protein